MEKATGKDLWSSAFEQLESSKQKILSDPSDPVGHNRSHVNTVELVIEQTHDAHEDCKKKGWRIRKGRGKDEINIRDQAKKLLGAALEFKSVIDSAVAFDPTGHASTAWTVVACGLQLAQNDHDRCDLLFKSSAFLADLLARSANIEAHYMDQNITSVDRLASAITDVYVATLQYVAAVRSTGEQNALKRSLAAFNALAGQPLQSLQESVIAKDKEVEVWRGLVSHEYRQKEFEESSKKADLMLDKLDRIAMDLSTMKKAVLTQGEECLLQWISSIKVSESYNRSLKLREAGTGQWLLTSQIYKEWRTSAQTFLWLHGTCKLSSQMGWKPR